MSTPQITDAQIAESAFLLWLDEGKPAGREQEHWFRARTLLETPAAPKARRTARKAPAASAAKDAAPKKTAAAKPRKAKAKA